MFSLERTSFHYLSDLIVVIVILVERQFIIHPKTDDQRYRHAEGKPTDIDKGITLCFNEVSPGDREIVFEHDLIIEVVLVLNLMIFMAITFYKY